MTVDGDAQKLQVTPEMPGLAGTIPPAVPAQRLGFLAKDRLLRLEGLDAGEPGGEFVRNANGRVAWLRTGRIHRRVESPTSMHHRDPFDRLLAAQALVERVPLVTRDRVFRKYGVKTVW